MEYISTKEAAKKWGISTIRITVLANEGRIPGAQLIGKNWLIPATATKPAPRKANHSASKKKQVSEFSFPLYPFRPDWNSTKEAKLSMQQQSLLEAEYAVLECRFSDAYSLLEPIISNPNDIYTEIGSLWNAAICCVALNKPESFSKILLRLQMILSVDFPHRDDLIVTLDVLNTYVETMGSISRSNISNSDTHYQSLPLTCLVMGYTHLAKEALNPGSADVALLELILGFLKTTSAVIAIEMLHCYLLGIYYLRHDEEAVEKHARLVIQIAFENNYYFPLVTYYRYFTQILSPLLKQYPEEFQNHLQDIISQYEENFVSFFSTNNKYSSFSKLTDADYPYIYAVLNDLTIADIAKNFDISLQTAKRKMTKIYEKLGVSNKKELKNYLHNYM